MGYKIQIPIEKIPKEFRKELFIRMSEWSYRATNGGVIENYEVLNFPDHFNEDPTKIIVDFMLEFKLSGEFKYNYRPYRKSEGTLIFKDGNLIENKAEDEDDEDD